MSRISLHWAENRMVLRKAPNAMEGSDMVETEHNHRTTTVLVLHALKQSYGLDRQMSMLSLPWLTARMQRDSRRRGCVAH